MGSTPRIHLSFKRKLLFSIAFGLIFAGVMYLGLTLFRIHRIYNFVKTFKAGITGHIFRNDRVLGFAPIPGARGSEVSPVRSPVPIQFDQHGFRIPVSQSPARAVRSPLILALGDSFTFGLGGVAEEAYPYIVARGLGGVELNSGVPSYGFSQMVLLAQAIIPRFKPKYVIVSFAPWLIDRSISHYSVLQFGFATPPYFVDTSIGNLSIHPPAFPSKMFEVPASEFRTTPESLTDYFSFLARVGFPLYLHSDFQRFSHLAKLQMGFVRSPTTDRDRVLRFTYSKILELCVENDAQMIIVLLHDANSSELAILRSFTAAPLSVPIVDAKKALYDRLPEKTEAAYQKAYWQWQGPVLVDWHPNAAAHRVIAVEILKSVR